VPTNPEDVETELIALYEAIFETTVQPARRIFDMANFDIAELALKSIYPTNAIKYDDKEMPSIIVFFCHPYFAYERGSNENMNRLIRRFFPKGTNFDNVTKEQAGRGGTLGEQLSAPTIGMEIGGGAVRRRNKGSLTD